jgi:hypothetical protein
MNIEAEAKIQATAQAAGRPGIHMSASAGIVVPFHEGFGPRTPNYTIKVDLSKVYLIPGS